MEKIDPALFTWKLKNLKRCVEEVSSSFMDVEFAKQEIIPSHLPQDALLGAS